MIFYSVHPCIGQHIVVHVVTSSTQDVDITIAIRCSSQRQLLCSYVMYRILDLQYNMSINNENV